MPNVLPAYGWDRRLGRYRDEVTGQFVSRDRITGLLEQRVNEAEQRLANLTAAYQAGKIAPSVWAVAMREEIKTIHLQNIALAKGGWDRLTQQDYGRVGAAVKAIYPKIAGSAADIQAGTVSEAQMLGRITNYVGSARALYYQAEREQMTFASGMVRIERRLLDPGAQHCGDCITYADRGWQPLGTLPVPGNACKCSGRCRCSMQYRDVPTDELGQWLESDRTMPPVTLTEARNVGEWIEARIHQMFTNIADDMFGDGRLTREERIALSGSIWSALDAFRATLEERAAGLYSRDPYRDPASPSPVDIEEAGDLSPAFVELIEKAIRRDGTIPIKVIAPGWGSSGYYPAEVLERSASMFPAGLQMFWDHQTASEEIERPEGELDDLAAVLTSGARWDANGPAGAGLYADAKVFPHYQESVDSLAPHIGVSIRATGRATQGEAEGRKGPIVQSIATVRSIDFVTKPGAGGQIISMFEAARPARQPVTNVVEEQINMDELKEALAQVATLTAQNARLTEGLILREAKDIAVTELAKSTLPAMAQTRLASALSANPPVADGALDKATFATKIAEAIADETAYLQQVAGFGGGRVEGMGMGTTKEEPAMSAAKRLEEAFSRLPGMTAESAKSAASGRLF